MMLVDQ